MSLPSLQLAETDLRDLDAVMTIMDDGFDPVFGEAWTAPQCAGLLPMPGVWLSIARDGEEAVGFAMGRAIGGESELLLLVVKRASRGQGIGQALLDRFEAISLARAARHFHLEVREGNPAIKLYEKAGFSEVGRRRNYYRGRDGQLYDALTFAKTVKA